MQIIKTQIEPCTSMLKTERIISNHYDYNQVLAFLENKGKEIYGVQFKFQSDDRNILIQLAAYFLQDQEVCRRNNIDTEKGIMLTGPIGCGKTTLMNLMRYVSAADKRCILKSTRDITFEFIKDGYDVIHRYTREVRYQQQHRVYCFDDLGAENNIKYYGNECNVMAEILLTRYDLFVSQRVITHVTTNLSATELEEAYGNRLRSRLREMVNLVSFDQNTKDKRK